MRLWPGIPNVDSKPERKIIRRDDGAFVLDAATPISDVAELLGLKEVTEKDFVTIAGLLLSKLDHVLKDAPNNNRYEFGMSLGLMV